MASHKTDKENRSTSTIVYYDMQHVDTYMTNDVTWSVRFLHSTLCNFRISGFNKICRVPVIPPATITSLLPTICFLGLFTSTVNSTPQKWGPLPTSNTWATRVLIKKCGLFLAGSMYAVAALLLSSLRPMENWFHAIGSQFLEGLRLYLYATNMRILPIGASVPHIE